MSQSNRTCSACLQLQQQAEEQAVLAPKTMQCYAGLHETAVPVRVGDNVIGYLQTGQVFLRAPTKRQFNAITPLLPVQGVGAGRRRFETAYFRTKVVAPAQYESIIRLLGIFAEHLAMVSNQMLIADSNADSPLITKVRHFIAAHQNDDLCLQEVARAMNMSAFYFCKVFKKTTGLTFTEYLARERIEAVKQHLLSIHIRISEAAFAAGFQSLSQFNRVFRRITGETPTGYRDRLHTSNRKLSRPNPLVNAA